MYPTSSEPLPPPTGINAVGSNREQKDHQSHQSVRKGRRSGGKGFFQRFFPQFLVEKLQPRSVESFVLGFRCTPFPTPHPQGFGTFSQYLDGVLGPLWSLLIVEKHLVWRDLASAIYVC